MQFHLSVLKSWLSLLPPAGAAVVVVFDVVSVTLTGVFLEADKLLLASTAL